ncbi:MAG TPA: ATP synthase F1 subunit gamma [Acidimicrobiales bacterium]|jgi:F-type H+-transporting ATPase subunit gamma|nr:ATP synthase F1 subunit gamma [Acidimicrobiales bacterium]HVX17592.1 ATP synthase F1 subunit gamma [Acidimicrobiales bacterium]
MPEQPKVIRKRIRSVNSIQKLTRTMEMVATAKLRAAQDAVASSGPYLDNLRKLMGDIGASGLDVSEYPYFEVREGKRTLLFVVTANRGQCGAFNANLVRLARDTYHAKVADGHDVRLFAAGKKGVSALRFAGFDPERTYVDELVDRPTSSDAEFFLNELAKPFLDHEVDEVLVVYPHWISVGSQPPTVLRLFPIAPEHAGDATGRAPLFEPSAEAILQRLLPLYGRQLMFAVLAEAVAAEQVARRTAMKLASDNASDMVTDLTLQYNKARQAVITKEIAEILGGAEALKN